jgi:hypothetical protein
MRKVWHSLELSAQEIVRNIKLACSIKNLIKEYVEEYSSAGYSRIREDNMDWIFR